MAGSYHGARGDYVAPMSRLAVLTAAVAVVGANASFAYAAPPRGDAEQALRAGRYEQARRLACATGRARARRGQRDPARRARRPRWRSGARAMRATARGGRGGPPRRSAGARRAHAPLRRRRRSRRAGPADRRELRRLERRQGRPEPAGRSDRDRDRRPPGRQLEGRQRRACATPSAPNPRATAANLDWGDVLLEKHNGADAEAAFKDVLKVDPDNPDAHVGLARVAVADRYDGAAALERAARARSPSTRPTPAALALRAALALDAENWAGAAADVAAIRRTNPHDVGAARVAAAVGAAARRSRRVTNASARPIWPCGRTTATSSRSSPRP